MQKKKGLIKSKKVAIYCRLARKDFLRIREQKKELVEFARGQGYVDFRRYIDNGVSGSTIDRPAFSKLNKAIQNGEIDTIIMWDITRIARNYLLVPAWIEETEKAGVKLVMLQGGQPLQKIDFTSIMNLTR